MDQMHSTCTPFKTLDVSGQYLSTAHILLSNVEASLLVLLLLPFYTEIPESCQVLHNEQCALQNPTVLIILLHTEDK